MLAVRKILDRFLEVICSIILVVMVLLVLYQIFMRTVMNNPNTITEEFVRFSLIWLSLFASAYVVGKKSHLAVSLLSDNLSPANRHRLDLIVQVLFVIFALVVMIFGGLKALSVTTGQVSPAMGISMGWVYLAVPISGALILVYSLLNLFQHTATEIKEN